MPLSSCRAALPWAFPSMDPVLPPTEQVAPPRKKPLSALSIVLIVLGAMALLCAGAIGAGAFWVKGRAEQFLREAGDGGFAMIAQAPDEVRAALAGEKRDYVGVWSSDRGSRLEIREDGALSIRKAERAGSSTQFSLPIAAFSGDDIVCRAMVTLNIKVSQPPSRVGGRWEMVAEGITFHRP